MKKLFFACFAASAILMSCGESAGDKDTSRNEDTTASMNNETAYNDPSVMAGMREAEAPDPVKKSFTEKYPKANSVSYLQYSNSPDMIDWELSGWPAWDTSYYVVRYNDNGYDNWVFYTPSGEWISTVSTVNNASLPAAVNATINREFPGYTIEEISKENDKDRSAFEIKMEKGEDKMKALIDMNGNIMKKKGKVNDEKVKEKNV